MNPHTFRLIVSSAQSDSLREALLGLQRAVGREFLGSSDGNIRVVVSTVGAYASEQSIEAAIGLGAVIMAPEKAIELAAELHRAIALASAINAAVADRKWR